MATDANSVMPTYFVKDGQSPVNIYDSCTPGLFGLITQLPRYSWTAEQRTKFLEAFILVLDFSITQEEAATKANGD